MDEDGACAGMIAWCLEGTGRFIASAAQYDSHCTEAEARGIPILQFRAHLHR